MAKTKSRKKSRAKANTSAVRVGSRGKFRGREGTVVAVDEVSGTVVFRHDPADPAKLGDTPITAEEFEPGGGKRKKPKKAKRASKKRK